MKRILGLALICAMTVGTVTGCSPVVIEDTETSETTAEKPASPKDDYYIYVNEDRLKNAVFKYGETTAAEAFDQDMIDEQIETLINDTVAGSGYAKGSCYSAARGSLRQAAQI